MHRLLRTVLTWLLVLALPAQGYAAQAMLFCGPGHHGGAASEGIVSVAHDHAEHPGGHTESGASHEAVHVHAHADTADTHAATDDLGAAADKPAKAQSLGADTCSACAACCSAAAMTSTSPTLAALQLTPEYGIAAIEHHGSRAGDGLERPPRTFLA